MDYVNECRRHIKAEGLGNYVAVYHQSILDYNGGPYDAVYFSGSLMILPDPVQALNRAKNMLTKNGKIFITQTIETYRSDFVQMVKPLLKYILTVDFGNVTYEDEILAAFEAAKLTMRLNKPISGSSIKDTRSYRMFVLERSA